MTTDILILLGIGVLLFLILRNKPPTPAPLIDSSLIDSSLIDLPAQDISFYNKVIHFGAGRTRVYINSVIYNRIRGGYTSRNYVYTRKTYADILHGLICRETIKTVICRYASCWEPPNSPNLCIEY